jgi:hypothetical protein
LLEGLWNQAANATPTTKGLLLEQSAGKEPIPVRSLPKLPVLGDGRGFTLDLWFEAPADKAGSLLIDAVDKEGRGFRVGAGGGILRFTMMDGNAQTHAVSDPGMLPPGRPHHAAIIVDGGPRIVTFVVDGILCDGGSGRQFGWTRFDPAYADVSGDGPLRLNPAGDSGLKSLRVYDRALRTSEAVANYRAGLR